MAIIFCFYAKKDFIYKYNDSHTEYQMLQELKPCKIPRQSLENSNNFCHPVKEQDNPHDNHDITADFDNFAAVFPDPFHPADKEGQDKKRYRKTQCVSDHV